MTIYQHIRNFPPEGKTGPKKGQAFLWCTLVGRKRRKKKSEHHILYWDKTNYLGENCLQNHPIQIHTSHSVIPKGHPHYRNVCCPHWKGHGMLSAAQTLNNWMTSPRKLAKQTWGKKKRGGKKATNKWMLTDGEREDAKKGVLITAMQWCRHINTPVLT